MSPSPPSFVSPRGRLYGGRGFDAFCGGGGCTRGYQLAGFEMWGCDVKPQPRYVGERFFQADALELLADLDFMAQFDFVSASPPCQAYSDLRTMPGVAESYPKLVDDVRELLRATGLPWVIENVPGAPLAYQDTLDGRFGVRLDGAMFGLEEAAYGLERERWFECSFPIVQPNGRRRAPLRVGVHGGGQPGRADGRDRRVMGIDWMTREELNEAIPPAYTQHVGASLMQHIRSTPVLASAGKEG